MSCCISTRHPGRPAILNPPTPLARPQPPRFEFYDPQTPIYTSPRFLPPAKLVDCQLKDAIVSHGVYLEECTIDNAIIGLRSRVNKGVVIRVRRRGGVACGACG